MTVLLGHWRRPGQVAGETGEGNPLGLPAAPGAAREHTAQRQPPEGRPGGLVTPPKTSQNENQDSTTTLFSPGWRPTVTEWGGFLLDWLTIIIPCRVPRGNLPRTGLMWFVGPDGSAEGFRHRTERTEGSWSTTLAVSVHDGAVFDAELARYCHAMDMDLMWFRVDGNPTKYLQGVNVFGSTDVLGLAERMVEIALDAVGFGSASGVVPMLERGYFNRIDATWNFDLGDKAGAAALIRELGKLATIKHRRSSTLDGTLVFPGRRSRLSIYHKGPEMRAHPPAREVPGLVEFADRLVRFEVTSRSERLDEMGLRKVSVWSYSNSRENLFDLWFSFLLRLRFPVMSTVDLSALSAPARRAYSVWASGNDVIAHMSQATAYRHRNAILKAGGPDILLPKPDAASSVVHFRRVLTPRPVVVPAEFAALVYHPRAA